MVVIFLERASLYEMVSLSQLDTLFLHTTNFSERLLEAYSSLINSFATNRSWLDPKNFPYRWLCLHLLNSSRFKESRGRIFRAVGSGFRVWKGIFEQMIWHDQASTSSEIRVPPGKSGSDVFRATVRTKQASAGCGLAISY